jgi:Domain of unknown function (DUF4835)
MINLLSVPLLVLALLWAPVARAEEFFASVSVQAGQVANIDQQVFEQMQRDIQEYLNNNRFTEHVFLPEERLRLRITIVITSAPSNDQFQATATFQAKRTAYNSSYETLVYNFDDKFFNFRYVAFQPLQYSENAFVDNLTSLLNFHALMALGFDYGSFKQDDGIPLFERARNMLNLAQGSNERGWQAMEQQLQGFARHLLPVPPAGVGRDERRFFRRARQSAASAGKPANAVRQQPEHLHGARISGRKTTRADPDHDHRLPRR